MMSYPTERKKGRYFAWFWGIFNVGACIGALVRLPSISSVHIWTLADKITRLDSPRPEHPRHREEDRQRRHLHRLHRADGLRRRLGPHHLRR